MKKKVKKSNIENFIINTDTNGNKWLLKYIGCEQKINIPYGIYGISKRAFSPEDVDTITHVYIHETVQVIGNKAFFNCKKLRKVKFEGKSKLKHINKCAFYNCYSLRRIYLPDSLETIGKCAFIGCPLELIYLSENLKKIGESAFDLNYQPMIGKAVLGKSGYAATTIMTKPKLNMKLQFDENNYPLLKNAVKTLIVDNNFKVTQVIKI